MIFKAERSYEDSTFWEVSSGGLNLYFLPRVRIRSGSSLSVESLDKKINTLNLPISLGYAGDLKEPQAYFIYSRIPVKNLGTGLLLTHGSWKIAGSPLSPSELQVVLKLPSLYIFHARNKATVISSCSLNSTLEDHLTII